MKKWYVITAILAILFIFNLVSYYSAHSRAIEAENELLKAQSDLAHTKEQLIEATNYINEINKELRLKQSEVELHVEYVDEAKFTFYYVTRSEQRYGVDDLAEYLNRWQWNEGTYTVGEFDCSEMSAYLERKLENEGYHAVIVAKTTQGILTEHSWLLVETSAGKYMPVEATSYELVYWEHPNFDNYFDYDYEFETIQEALEYSPNEFDWWNS